MYDDVLQLEGGFLVCAHRLHVDGCSVCCSTVGDETVSHDVVVHRLAVACWDVVYAESLSVVVHRLVVAHAYACSLTVCLVSVLATCVAKGQSETIQDGVVHIAKLYQVCAVVGKPGVHHLARYLGGVRHGVAAVGGCPGECSIEATVECHVVVHPDGGSAQDVAARVDGGGAGAFLHQYLVSVFAGVPCGQGIAVNILQAACALAQLLEECQCHTDVVEGKVPRTAHSAIFARDTQVRTALGVDKQRVHLLWVKRGVLHVSHAFGGSGYLHLCRACT